MALSKIEKQLARLAASLPRTDPALQMLLRVTDLPMASVGLTITVLIDGYLIRGNIMGSRRYAEQLEQGLEAGISELIERVGTNDPRGELAGIWRTAIVGKFSELVDQEIAEEDEQREAIERIAADKGVSIDDLDLDDLPDDLAYRQFAYGASRSVLTLENAVLITPPTFREGPLGVVRIHTSQIGAWWTRTGEGEPLQTEAPGELIEP